MCTNITTTHQLLRQLAMHSRSSVRYRLAMHGWSVQCSLDWTLCMHVHLPAQVQPVCPQSEHILSP